MSTFPETMALSETGDGSGLKLPTLILLCSAKPTINWSKDLLIGGSAKRLYCVFPAKESQLKVYSSFYHPSKIIRTLMIRGRRRVHLINVSVLPRLCLAAASLACDVWTQLRPGWGRGKQVSRATRGGGALDQTRVTLTLGSDLLARVRMRP